MLAHDGGIIRHPEEVFFPYAGEAILFDEIRIIEAIWLALEVTDCVQCDFQN